MDEIVAAYKKLAVDLLKDPDHAENLTNQLTLLVTRGDRNASHLALARRAVALAPNEFATVFNLAAVEARAGHYDASLVHFNEALQIAPTDRMGEALHHIGLAWHDLGDFDKALDWYEKAIPHIPNERELRASIAIAHLMRGELAKGLFQYECQYHKPLDRPIYKSGIKRWMGEDLTDKTLIVAHEQGYGDTLQFCRVIPRLKAKRIIWSGPPLLERLITENFKFDGVMGQEGPFPDADFYCSPISACGALGLEYKDIDGAPYLRSDAQKLPNRGKLKAGISWAGNKDYAHDSHRSMKLKDLMPLFEIPHAAFYSLQVGRGTDEIHAAGLDGFIADLGGTLRDWKDTARAIMAMDVVVCTDSANAHLAGALGKPVLLLLPYSCCWRWMRKGITTPWYRNTRLFRQAVPEMWPIGYVRTALEEMLNGRRTEASQAA